jgi:aconitate hydratase
MVESASNNPYDVLREELDVDGQKYQMFNITKLDNPEIAKLPVSIRVLLESAVRNCDSFNIQGKYLINLLIQFFRG